MGPGPNLKLGTLLLVVAFAMGSVALYGGALLVGSPKSATATGGTEAGGGGTVPSGPVAVTIVAQNTSFDKRTITAAAGAQVTVTLDNEDAGVPHNIAFFNKKGETNPIAKADLITGVATENLQFNAPTTPGVYYFECQVHPDQMNGSFIVK